MRRKYLKLTSSPGTPTPHTKKVIKWAQKRIIFISSSTHKKRYSPKHMHVEIKTDIFEKVFNKISIRHSHHSLLTQCQTFEWNETQSALVFVNENRYLTCRKWKQKQLNRIEFISVQRPDTDTSCHFSFSIVIPSYNEHTYTLEWFPYMHLIFRFHNNNLTTIPSSNTHLALARLDTI